MSVVDRREAILSTDNRLDEIQTFKLHRVEQAFPIVLTNDATTTGRHGVNGIFSPSHRIVHATASRPGIRSEIDTSAVRQFYHLGRELTEKPQRTLSDLKTIIRTLETIIPLSNTDGEFQLDGSTERLFRHADEPLVNFSLCSFLAHVRVSGLSRAPSPGHAVLHPLFPLRSYLFPLRSSLFAPRSSLFALTSSLFALPSSLLLSTPRRRSSRSSRRSGPPARRRRP